MDKFVILTGSEMISWGSENLPDHFIKAGADGTGMFGFTTVPAALSSKTVYNKSQTDTMLRDNTSPFYTEGY